MKPTYMICALFVCSFAQRCKKGFATYSYIKILTCSFAKSAVKLSFEQVSPTKLTQHMVKRQKNQKNCRIAFNSIAVPGDFLAAAAVFLVDFEQK